jgi:hypothetical protein
MPPFLNFTKRWHTLFSAVTSKFGVPLTLSTMSICSIEDSELEAQVPSHAQNDDFAIKVATCEQLLQTFAPAHTDLSIRHALKLTGSATASCTRTGVTPHDG